MVRISYVSPYYIPECLLPDVWSTYQCAYRLEDCTQRNRGSAYQEEHLKACQVISFKDRMCPLRNGEAGYRYRIALARRVSLHMLFSVLPADEESRHGVVWFSTKDLVPELDVCLTEFQYSPLKLSK